MRNFIDDHVELSCVVDTREQLPYTEQELGIKCISRKNDFGDYTFFGEYKTDDDELNTFNLGIAIERKGGNGLNGGPQDFYGSTMVRKNSVNLYEEVGRFRDNKDFDIFLIFVECSYAEYLAYVIPSKRCNMRAEIMKTHASRRGKVASLEIQGAQVCFKGSRFNSAKDVKVTADQWMIKHYDMVLNL